MNQSNDTKLYLYVSSHIYVIHGGEKYSVSVINVLKELEKYYFTTNTKKYKINTWYRFYFNILCDKIGLTYTACLLYIGSTVVVSENFLWFNFEL